ncbi:MFS transporter [Paenibacillus lentus]|uniref:MFS transporter n=1 Tax=Paenibacillus lentus TaxID=1338368 RepID=A0A3S8S1G0_9BACL|nr:MFS transporter [Paenibacillus lentus]AZK48919.1 MFS transporter [Paenibacillus lentus]
MTHHERSSLLSIRSFRSMFAAYALASFGDWFDALAIQVLVAYRWGADPIMLALIPVMMALPAVLFGSFAGTVADRVRKARLMMACDLLTAALTLCILAAPNMAWLLPLLALRSACGVFHIPAQQALTRQIVPLKLLFQATSLNGLVNQSSKVAGPLLGAMTLTVMSPQACIMLNMAARLFSAALLWPLRLLPVSPLAEESRESTKATESKGVMKSQVHQEAKNSEHGAKGSFLRSWREGWLYLFQAKKLLFTMMFGFIGLTSLLMIDYQFPTLLRSIEPTNEVLIGWLVSAIGAGAIIMLVIMNRLNRIRYGWGLGGGYVLIGVGIAFLGLCPPGTGPFLLLGLGIVIGVGNGLYMVTQNYILQQETSEDMVGRIFGIQNTMISLVKLTAPLIGGVLVTVIEVGKAFMLIGFITALIGLAGIVFRTAIWGSPAISKDRASVAGERAEKAL